MSYDVKYIFLFRYHQDIICMVKKHLDNSNLSKTSISKSNDYIQESSYITDKHKHPQIRMAKTIIGANMDNDIKELKNVLNKITMDTYRQLSKDICVHDFKNKPDIFADIICETAFVNENYVKTYYLLINLICSTHNNFKQYVLKKCKNTILNTYSIEIPENLKSNELDSSDFFEKKRTRYYGCLDLLVEMFRNSFISSIAIDKTIDHLFSFVSNYEELYVDYICHIFTRLTAYNSIFRQRNDKLMEAWLRTLVDISNHYHMNKRDKIYYKICDILDGCNQKLVNNL